LLSPLNPVCFGAIIERGDDLQVVVNMESRGYLALERHDMINMNIETRDASYLGGPVDHVYCIVVDPQWCTP
jgi:hypothetical protein